MHRGFYTICAAFAAVYAGLAICHPVAAESMPGYRALVPNRAPLEPTPFIQLPIGSVKPEAWLLKQLQLQKAGLTGSAEKLYDALTPNSGWLGGNGEGWEKGPYYVKGLIALAYTLDDAELKQRAQKWVDWVVQSQKPDGSFGPASNNDWWPRMIVLFYLRDYYEATGDERVIPFLQNYFRYQSKALPGRPLKDWGRARAGDNIDVVLWTYNRTGEPFLLNLAKLLYTQAYPWSSIFTDNLFYKFGNDFQPHHIVNVSQALKMPAVSWQFTHNPADKNAVAAGVENLQRQYGRIDGQISGTEMLSGLQSTAGVELCADVERIISNGIAIDILGDPALADQMEKVAYNSLPGHTSARMQQMTYYQLLNQATATIGGHGFTQDYPNGNVPGPHSGFPCCCYNWHTAWPKFVQNMWAATPDGGLALIAYGPNRVETTVANGVPITVTATTDYPFAETVSLKIDPKRPAKFPLLLRIPGWCKSPQISINGEAVAGLKPESFQRIDREWKPGDAVEIKMPMAVRASTWTNDSVGLERGPLAFALAIKENWKKTRDYLGDFDEYEVLPESPWNYALQIDRAAPDVTVQTHAVSDVPFDTDAPPVVLTVPARQLASWGYKSSPGVVNIGRANHGWQPITEATTPLAPSVPHHLRIVASGRSIRAFVDDMNHPILDRDDGTFTTGSIGLRTYDTAATFDDVKLNGKLVDDFSSGNANAWQTFGGNWTVRDGAYTVDAARDGKAILKNHDTLRDFTLDVTVTVEPGGNAGVIFRVSDAAPEVDGYRGYYVGLSTHKASQDAAEPPTSPVTSDAPTQQVELIPFGSAKLRISYFPVLQSK